MAMIILNQTIKNLPTVANQTINETFNVSGNISKAVGAAKQDAFSMVWGILTHPITLILIGILIGAVAMILIYKYIKGKDENLFEFEKFEDTVIKDIKENFEFEGRKSKAKLIHGFLNPIGDVNKILVKKGKWQLMKYNESKQKFEVVMQDVKIDTAKKDAKGKPIIRTESRPVTKEYDLKIFKIQEGWFIFKTTYFVAVDSKYLNYDPLRRIWDIAESVPIHSYGKVWMCSEQGQTFLDDISFRRALENNMTFIQNYSRKVIWLETKFAERSELLTTKGVAKKLAYDNYAKEVLIEAGETEATDET
jgi:hypothetical protein